MAVDYIFQLGRWCHLFPSVDWQLWLCEKSLASKMLCQCYLAKLGAPPPSIVLNTHIVAWRRLKLRILIYTYIDIHVQARSRGDGPIRHLCQTPLSAWWEQVQATISVLFYQRPEVPSHDESVQGTSLCFGVFPKSCRWASLLQFMLRWNRSGLATLTIVWKESTKWNFAPRLKQLFFTRTAAKKCFCYCVGMLCKAARRPWDWHFFRSGFLGIVSADSAQLAELLGRTFFVGMLRRPLLLLLIGLHDAYASWERNVWWVRT